jgi:hypothetical protein
VREGFLRGSGGTAEVDARQVKNEFLDNTRALSAELTAFEVGRPLVVLSGSRRAVVNGRIHGALFGWFFCCWLLLKRRSNKRFQ